MTSALDMPEIMSYIYSKSWKHKFSASSSIIIIEDYYLQTFLHSLLLYAQYNFPAGAYAKFYKNNISSLDDFNHKTAHDLYNICSQDYILTIKVYYILKKNGIILNDWNDKYLFEIMPEKTATRLWYRHQISTISQLSNQKSSIFSSKKVSSPLEQIR